MENHKRTLRWLVIVGAAAVGCPSDDEGSAPESSTSQGSQSTDTSSGNTSSGNPSSTAGATDSATSTTATPTGSGETGGGGLACEDESDCTLFSDCCSCEALHVDEATNPCPADCDQAACERWGVTELLCSGTCQIPLFDCDASTVECDAPTPMCDGELVPAVEAGCWRGNCVPLDLCEPA